MTATCLQQPKCRDPSCVQKELVVFFFLIWEMQRDHMMLLMEGRGLRGLSGDRTSGTRTGPLGFLNVPSGCGSRLLNAPRRCGAAPHPRAFTAGHHAPHPGAPRRPDASKVSVFLFKKELKKNHVTFGGRRRACETRAGCRPG